MALHPCLCRHWELYVEFCSEELRVSCHKRAPEPCSWLCSFVEWSSPFSLSVCPSCLSKALLHLLWIFFSIALLRQVMNLGLFILPAKQKCSYYRNALSKAYFFEQRKFELGMLFPFLWCNHNPMAGAVSVQLQGEQPTLRGSSVCRVLPARLVMSTMSLGMGSGQGRESCCHDNTNCNGWLFR